MTSTKDERSAKRHLASWLGALIGCTLGVGLLAGHLCLRGHFAVASAVAVCFLLPYVVALIIWRRRERIDPYVATQILVGVSGLGWAASFVILDVTGMEEVLANPRYGVRFSYWWLLIIPAVMGYLHFVMWLCRWEVRRSQRRARAVPQPETGQAEQQADPTSPAKSSV